ncbi:MAG TPA: right-handed parallel beta-helix repeat-containing protein, partial [Isosphaeraceae bacterium]|nr:right-handed parallel beta-helix repeat-containing protein [Isosphaeraceae bacterium]
MTFTGPTRGTASWTSLSKGQRFLAENVREALDEPGQWYLDLKPGTLTYLPKPGEDPGSTLVEAPWLKTLVHLKGNAEEHQFVRYLEFRGLTFSGSNWYSPPQGNSFPQAEAMLSAAIEAEGARDCSWSGCSVSHVGAYAINLDAGCQRNLIENCELTDLGGGGIKIGETAYQNDDEAVASGNTVRQTLIAHGGRMHPAAVGIWIGHSPHNTISHNEITDFYYSGISVGWSWGYGKSHAHHNRFEANHIHNLGQGVLSDMGGIYSLGVSPGTEMTLNRIHDVQSFDYGGWGIYFDEGSTDILARDNLVYRTKTGGFHQHYGRDNRVLNNIFAFSQEGQIIRTRPEPHRSFTFEHNIVYWSQGTLLGSNWSGDGFFLDHNLYWNAEQAPILFAGQTFEQWQKRGQDVHSRIADPHFADPEHG